MWKRKARLAGRVVLVTGAAGGIGSATCRRLAAHGARVVGWDRDEAGLERLRDSIGSGLERTDLVDVTDAAAVRATVESIEAAVGPIEILVNNAGILVPGAFHEQEFAGWQQTVEVNLTAQLVVTHAVMPYLYARGSGHVVNVCSAASFVGVAGLAVYSATKWALWGFSEALRHEARNLGVAVRVSSVHPNYVARGLFEGARVPGLGGLLFPLVREHDVVAAAIVEAALRRGRRVITRPRSVRLVPVLRGLVPDHWFSGLARALGVNRSMESWRGRPIATPYSRAERAGRRRWR